VGPPVVFGITMGVRPDEPEWKHKLNKLIAENQSDVDAILRQYNVPLLNDQGELVEAATPDR
jgi:hypothetical protein